MSTISITDGIALMNALTELGLKVWLAAEARRGQTHAGMTTAELVERVRALTTRTPEELIAEGERGVLTPSR